MRAIDGSPHVGREAFDAQQRIVDAQRLLDRVDLRAAEQRIRASELVAHRWAQHGREAERYDMKLPDWKGQTAHVFSS